MTAAAADSKQQRPALTSNAVHFLVFAGVALGVVLGAVAAFLWIARWIMGTGSWLRILLAGSGLGLIGVGVFSLLAAFRIADTLGRMVRVYTPSEADCIVLREEATGVVVVDKVLKPEMRRIQGARVVRLNRAEVTSSQQVAELLQLSATAATSTWVFHSDAQLELDQIAKSYYLRVGYACCACGALIVLGVVVAAVLR